MGKIFFIRIIQQNSDFHHIMLIMLMATEDYK